MIAVLILSLACMWGSGFAACRFTHRSKGIEVDKWEQIRWDPTDDLTGAKTNA